MSGNGEAFWKRMAEETHAKLVAAREQLARVTSDKHQQYQQRRDELMRACEFAREFIASTQRSGRVTDVDLRGVLGRLDAALSRAGGGA